MSVKKIFIGLALVFVGLVAGQMLNFTNVDTIKLSYADCDEGVLTTNRTFVMSIAGQAKIVHSLKEATSFLHNLNDRPKVVVLKPSLNRVKMGAAFCPQSQAEKEQALLTVVQAQLSN